MMSVISSGLNESYAYTGISPFPPLGGLLVRGEGDGAGFQCLES